MAKKAKATRKTATATRRMDVHKEDALIIALARGETHAEAAKSSGYSTARIAVKSVDPAFRARVDELRDELMRQAVGKMIASTAKVIDQLVKLALNGETEGTRLQACKAYLEQGLRWREAGDLAAKVARLQELVEARLLER